MGRGVQELWGAGGELRTAGAACLELRQQTCQVSLVGKPWNPVGLGVLWAGGAPRKEISHNLNSCSSPCLHFHTPDKDFISCVLFFVSVWVCALSSQWGQNWQETRFVVLRYFPPCGHWCQLVRDGKERADRKKALGEKSSSAWQSWLTCFCNYHPALGDLFKKHLVFVWGGDWWIPGLGDREEPPADPLAASSWCSGWNK